MGKQKQCKRCHVNGYMKELNCEQLCRLCTAEIAEGIALTTGYDFVRNQSGVLIELFHQDMETYKQRVAEAFGLMKGGNDDEDMEADRVQIQQLSHK